MSTWESIWQAIVSGVEWYFNSNLPGDTIAFLNRVITYTLDNFIPLMWDYYYTIFGITPPVI